MRTKSVRLVFVKGGLDHEYTAGIGELHALYFNINHQSRHYQVVAKYDDGSEVKTNYPMDNVLYVEHYKEADPAILTESVTPGE